MPSRATGRHRRRPVRRLVRWAAAVTAAGLVAMGVTAIATPATAADPLTPTVAVGVPDRSLQGATVAVTVTASNATSTNGYNTSFRVLVPTGATLASASPSPTSGPFAASGGSYYVFSNVADLLAGTSAPVTLNLATTGLPLDSTLTVPADVYVSTDARTIPAFTGSTPVTNAVVVSASGAGTGALVPFTLTKDVIAPENELVRGVHDHRTAVTMTLVASPLAATTAMSVVDYVPAGLEFLGCGTTDNTTAGTVEYPGADRLNTSAFPALSGSAGCPTPSSVVTAQVDPPGDQPLGVYTVVTWSTSDLAAVGADVLSAGESVTFHYVVAVPQKANTLTFTGGTPATTGAQASDLDNNNGASTIETATEQSAENAAVATGSYDDPNAAGGASPYSDRSTDTVTLEDLAIQKSASSSSIAQGATTTWSIAVEASEYTSSITGVTLVDTVPNGLRVTGSSPAAASAVEQANGTTVVTWNLADLAKDATSTVTLTTVTRTSYRANGADTTDPVRAQDSWTNTATITGQASELVNGVVQAPRTVYDDTSATQTAAPITLRKSVGAPVAGSCSTTSTWQDAQWPSSFGPGDLVCWKLDLTAPAGLDSTGVTLTDMLPAGYGYVSQYVPTGGTVNFSNLTASGQTLTWDLSGSNLGAGTTATVVVTTRITDPTAHQHGDIVTNLAKLAYRNTAQQVFQLRDDANAPWKEAELSVVKSAAVSNGTGGAVDGGSTITYTVAVTNKGNQDATAVAVRDLLPGQFHCADLTTLPTGGTCTAGSPDYVDATIASVAAGATVNLTYVVDVPSSVVPGQTATNTVGVRSYQTATDDPNNPVFTYQPCNSPASLVSGTCNTDAATATASTGVRAVGLTKTVVTAVNEAGNNAASQATPGEQVTYTVTMTVPKQTTLTAGVLKDSVPSTLSLVSATVTHDDTAGTFAYLTTAGVNTGFQVTLPTPYTAASDATVTVVVVATVKDANGPVAGATVTNTASVTGTSMGTVSASANVGIVEPAVAVAKSANRGGVTPGDTITYTLTVTNPTSAGSVSQAHDLTVTDVVPTSQTPLDIGGTPLATDGAAAGGATWTVATRTLTWTVATLDPGATSTLTYQVRVASPIPAPTSYTNTVAAVAHSLSAANGGGRTFTTSSGPSASRYRAVTSLTLSGPQPTITKTASTTTATIGELVVYTLTTTIPPNVATYDATVLDTLPAGMTYVATTATDCGGACTVTEIPASGQSLGWFLGDFSSSPSARTVTITYTARVATSAAAPQVETNAAYVASNATDKVSTPPTTTPTRASYDGSDGAASVNVTVIEPHLTLTKTVASGAAQAHSRHVVPGDTVTFTVSVTNDGGATAQDVSVTDTWDARLTSFSGTVAGWTLAYTAGAHTATWTRTTPLAAGSTASVSYTLTVPSTLGPADEVVGPEFSNTAQAGYSTLPGDQAPIERVYTSNTDADSLEADLGQIGDTVWFDTNRDGVQQAGEGPVAGVTVTVTGYGPDGVLGTADDVTRTTTTDASGHYLVDHLPAGTYRVAVSGLPSGTTTTYDEDSGTTTPDGVTTVALTEAAPSHLSADFGVVGTGTVGDKVWYDLNGDGVQQTGATGGEPGVGAVGVTVTWPAANGLPAGSVHTTTAADGSWTVSGVPATAAVTVTVDPATFPAGTHEVSEPHDGTVDHTATGALAAGASDLGYDFGLAGTAALGDRVWLDTNSDGVQDAGEPGIPGAVVEVRNVGADGVSGTADDMVVTTITGTDGHWLVDHLPPGSWTARVVSLPTALAPTYDEDSGTTAPDGRTTVTLAAGDTHLTADFGYVASTGVGDRVWLDTDGDGVQDPGEPGIPGVQLTVTSAGADGVLGSADDIVRTTTTGADGAWQVTGLPATLTRVQVTGGLPAGVHATYDATGAADGTSQVRLVAGTMTTTQDFGYVGDNSVGDRVWVDIDRDGVQDPGEVGLAGVGLTVTSAGSDGVLGTADDLTATTTTDATGAYHVGGLPDGPVTVAVTSGVPAGYVPTWDETAPADGRSSVDCLGCASADPVDHDTADFGYAGTGSLAGTVWLEQTVDGTQSGGTEPGLPSVVVDVVWAGPDGVLGTADDQTLSTTTDAQGHWSVAGLPPGPFTATVRASSLPAGTSVVWDRGHGTTSPPGALSGTLAAGENRTAEDTGVAGTASIGDLVWVDLDHDGVRDADDPGAAGVTVTVLWAGDDGTFGTADDVTLTTVTDASGAYLVGDLPAGSYRVGLDRVSLPAHTYAFTDLDGGDAAVTQVTLATGEHRTDVDYVLRRTATLAATGASVLGLLGLALLALVGGVVLVRRSRRRTA